MVAFLARAMPLESVFPNGRSPDVIEDLTRVYNYEHTPRVVARLPIADNLLRSDVRPDDGGPSWPSAASLQRADSRKFRTFPTESQVKHGCFVLVFRTSQPNLRSNTDVSSW